MHTQDNKYTIIFNGEIYNFKEIKKELINKGINFQNNSDTEVVLRGYELWGKEILKKLNGMFVFAIYDKKNKLLFIARDRAGEKPFYIQST